MEKCKRMKRQRCMSKNWIFLDYESPRGYASSLIARNALRWTRILIWMDQRSKTTPHFKMVFEYGVIRKTSYQLWFLIYQRVLPQACLLHPSMTPFKQEIDHSKSSSSSCTSPPMTSSTETDHSDHHPAIAPSESVDRQVRRHSYSSETSEELSNKPTKTSKPNINENHGQVRETRIIPTYWNSCKNSERILWMTEFLNTKTHTRVLLISYL